MAGAYNGSDSSGRLNVRHKEVTLESALRRFDLVGESGKYAAVRKGVGRGRKAISAA